MPVVLANNVAADVLGVVAGALKADYVLKGKSLFADKTGQRVASDAVTIIDQNDLREAIGPAPFDGEGVSAQRVVVVEQGILNGFLHDSYTAHRMGASSTANAGRGGFRSTPEVSVTNFFLQPGQASEEALIAAAGDGLYVMDAMGVHTANTVSGDFSFGVTGMTIEGGRLGRPVRGVTMAGNTRELLQQIKRVGSDVRFFGAIGAPSILVGQLTVSGN
jgi:PmbA protein